MDRPRPRRHRRRPQRLRHPRQPAQTTLPDPKLITTLGHDPSGYTTAFGAGAVTDAISQARPLLDAVLDHTMEHCTGQSLHSQLDTLRRNAHLIAAAPPQRQADAIQRLARDTDLSSSAITQIITTAIHTTAPPPAAPNGVPTPPWRHRSNSTVQQV